MKLTHTNSCSAMRMALSSLLAVALAALVIIGAHDSIADPENPVLTDRPAAATLVGQIATANDLPRMKAPSIDLAAVEASDLVREAAGLAPRFAIPNAVSVSPRLDGIWESAGEEMHLWRLRISSPGARSLNFGFTRFYLPEGARLMIYTPELEPLMRPITSEENAAHGQFWTPVLGADDMIIELLVPEWGLAQLELELGSINVGYRGFSKALGDKSGSCNIDVVCPEGNGWEDEISTVAAISTGGSIFCTGFMVNNTAEDQTPYFQTAYHCGIRSNNAASLVAYWNFETSTCGGSPDGSLSDWQSGAFLRAAYSTSDVTLVELDSLPNPAWGVTYAGWNRSGADVSSAVAIHHPSGDEKRISFENDATTTTSYLGTSVPGDGTHVRVIDWDLGTTEGGSSGSPLFDSNHRVIGQLHGGYAACGNDSSDWYGKLSISWTGGGSSSTRLSDWLDPQNTGVMTLDTLVPSSGPCDFDGTCETGEDCNNCAADCISGSGGSVCGNGVCDAGAGEDCVSCPSDCNGVQTGKPSNRFCCGDGDGTNPVDCTDARCATSGWSCSSAPGTPYCCGDGFCEGDEDSSNCALDCGAGPYCGDGTCDPGEDQCNCATDCGAPAVSESSCSDSVDNDCDGSTDCLDSDCDGDPSCPSCGLRGESCTLNSDCCSNRCHRGSCK